MTFAELKTWESQLVALEREVIAAKADPYQRYNEWWSGFPATSSPERPNQRTAGFEIRLQGIVGPARAGSRSGNGRQQSVEDALSTAEAYTVAHDYLHNLLFS